MTSSELADIKKQLESRVGGLKDPETGQTFAKQGQLVSIDVTDDSASVKLGLASFSMPIKDDIAAQLEAESKPVIGGERSLEIEIVEHDRPAKKMGQAGLTAKAVIAVGSGKGGVGKSTVAASIALALAKTGSKVGLLDTDVYGPSVPTLTGVQGQPHVVENQIQPLDWNGIPVMSIGFLVPPSEAVIWRGPMLHQTVARFVRDVAWGDLDYLIVDMPPGTGDVALSLSQMLPVTGSVVVCTPQDVALADAIKAVGMFRKVKIPILGVVENMSGFVCPGCNKTFDIFGKGGAREYAAQEAIPFLGELPINISIRERGDEGGMQKLIEDPQIAPYLEKVGYQLARTLADQAIKNPPTPKLPVLG